MLKRYINRLRDKRQLSLLLLAAVFGYGQAQAALGMRFYTGNSFPQEYRNRIFIAQHGSWNRSKKVGYKIVSVDTKAPENQPRYQVFAEGWLDDKENVWGRPVDVQVLPDGSLLVSDDHANAIYRILYKGQTPPLSK